MITSKSVALVFFSLEYPALYCNPPSRIFADGLRFARKHFPTHIYMRSSLDVTEIRSNQIGRAHV